MDPAYYQQYYGAYAQQQQVPPPLGESGEAPPEGQPVMSAPSDGAPSNDAEAAKPNQ